MNLCKKIVSLLVILFAIIFSYWKLPKAFFQQDEWLALGNFIYAQFSGGLLKLFLDSTIYNRTIHLVPLTTIYIYLQFKLFALSFTPYAVASIATHALNSTLVFYLVYLVLRNRLLAFLSAILFALNSVSSQTITWIAASIPAQSATLFLLLSIILFLKYLGLGEENRKLLYLSLLAFFIGLLFKESIAFLFFFIPVIWFIYSRKKTKQNFAAILIPLFGLGVMYFLLRVPGFFLATPKPFESSMDIFTGSNPIIYLLRIPMLIFRIIPQSILPTHTLIGLSDNFIRFVFPQYIQSDNTANPFISQTLGLDIISYFTSTIFLFLAYVFYKRFMHTKENKKAKGLIFSLALIILSSIPFIFIPGVAGYASIIEPRDLYMATLGSGILVVLLTWGVAQWFFRRNVILIILAVGILLAFHYRIIHRDLNSLIEASNIRENTLTQIINKYPTLYQKTVFYVISDKAYYGLPPGDNILPFQSGFGQTLLVWYYFHNQKLPSCFFANRWLYNIDEEGYKFCEERGFGYFRKIDSLKKAITRDNFSADDVIAFKFNSETNLLKDITTEIRSKLLNK